MRASKGKCSRCRRSIIVGCTRPALCDNCKKQATSIPDEIILQQNLTHVS